MLPYELNPCQKKHFLTDHTKTLFTPKLVILYANRLRSFFNKPNQNQKEYLNPNPKKRFSHISKTICSIHESIHRHFTRDSMNTDN